MIRAHKLIISFLVGLMSFLLFSSIVHAQTQLVPFYRWFYSDGISKFDHFYTTDPTGEFAPSQGYVYQGFQWYVSTIQIPDTTPFYRWWNNTIFDHFYTTDPTGEDAPTTGYVYQGVACYVATTQILGTTPLYRWWYTDGISNGDHFYTTDPTGEDAPTTGYVYEGIAGYVWLSTTGMIVNIGSGRCLNTYDDGDPVTIADCDSSPDQLFTQHPDGTIRVLEDFCLDIAGSMVTVRGCDGRETQKWTLKDGWLRNSIGKCANVQKGKQTVGAPLVLSSCNKKKQSEIFTLIPAGTSVEQCFGAVGSKCEGVPVFAPAGPRTSDGYQRLYVSVGSIAHDNCCLQFPDGFACQTWDWLSALRTLVTCEGGEGNCWPEFSKACKNTREKKQWHEWFGSYSISSVTDDLTPSSDPPRHIGLPTGYVPLKEVVRTRTLAAPKNTRLDITDIEFCLSGQATFPKGKDYLICK